MPGCPRFFRVLLSVGWTLLVVGSAQLGFALDPARSVFHYNCQTWQRVNGLPANSVNAITQTADGRLWLGTPQGLIYFNGVDFSVVGAVGNDAIITTLARRGTEGLWFGLKQGGFGIFDGRAAHVLPMPESILSMPSVHHISEGANGSMLLAANSVAGRQTGTNSFTSMLPVPEADVFAIFEDAQGRVWMGTAEHGVFFWENGKVTPFPDATLRGAVVSSIAVDSAGNIWMGTAHSPKGLRCYDANFQSQPINQTIPNPNALLIDRHGVLWIGTSGMGLGRYKDGEFTFFRKQDGLAGDHVLTLAESENGSLWIGTMDGLTQLSDVRFPTLSQGDGLVAEACFAVAPLPDGGICAGTPNGVSFYRDGKFSNFGANGADGFGSSWIKHVFVARNGDAYFAGVAKNLDRFSGGRVVNTWTNGLWPRVVTEDAAGIVAAFAGELMRITDDNLVPYRLADGSSVSLTWINYLLPESDGSLWVAYERGVCQIKDGVLHDWGATNGAGNIKFFYLCEDDSGAIWAAQFGGGIARFKTGTMRRLTRSHGLHDDSVSAIVPDKLGNFWMDSFRGIFRVSQRDLNAVADGAAERVKCDVYDGLDSVKTTDKMEQNHSGCRSADGRIWFPGSKGVIVIDPARVSRNSTPPAVFIEGLRVNGRQFATDVAPALEPGSGNLEFNYSALDYAAPQKVQYRYRLEGYESDWVNAGGRRSAFYTNIKPGQYRFHVQACNSDGVWNKTGASLPVNLPRRLHETFAFRAACAAAILGLAAYFWWTWHVRQRELRLQKVNALMETRVRERTAELAAANTALVGEIEQRRQAQARSEQLHEQLLDVSRRAGQAEVASSVLHNVGNVLNSVNISTTVLNDRLRSLRLESLSKATDLMERNGRDTEPVVAGSIQDQKLAGYLKHFGNYLRREQTEMVAELQTLAENVEHIKEIVAMQQSYAKVSGVLERTSVCDLVDNALRMHAGGYQRHGVDIRREYEPVPETLVDKHKVLQILVNVIHNAKYACDAGPQGHKQVVVRTRREAQDRFSISVQDNGVGIAPENLTRIFSHGFTTRKNGHGFGLHSSALAAQELGGKLSAASDGIGRGATFTLELPLRSPTSEE